MTETTSKKPIHKILILLSIVSFVGSTAFGLVGMYTSALNPPKEDTQTAQANSIDSQLQAQEKGYAAVLQREPENQLALQGLIEVRLKQNDLNGAVAPLEKLVKLNPDRADYKTLLAEMKKQVGQGETKGKVGDR